MTNYPEFQAQKHILTEYNISYEDLKSFQHYLTVYGYLKSNGEEAYRQALIDFQNFAQIPMTGWFRQLKSALQTLLFQLAI